MMTDLAKLWLAGIGWYAGFTLPALVFPQMYFISIVIALVLSIPAVLIFVAPTFLSLIWPPSRLWDRHWLYGWVAVAVALGFELLNYLPWLKAATGIGSMETVWSAGPFLAFPFAALLAGWMSARQWVNSWPFFPHEEVADPALTLH